MNGRRSVRRRQEQQAEAIEIISDASDDNPSGSSESSAIPENRWHVCNSKNPVSPFVQQTVDNEEENRGHPSNRGQLEFTREVIARESSSSTQLSHTSTASQQKTIYNFPDLILLVILRYIIGQCTVKKVIAVVIVFVIIYGAIYTYCQYQKSTDVFASKELAKVYEDELKSLWKSQKALEEQFQEIEPLKHQIEHLHAEITRVNESLIDSVKQILRESDIPGEKKDEVLEMIKKTFKKLYEDHVQMADWAQKTLGATIDQRRTSRTYEPENVQDCWFKSFFISAANPPDTILQAESEK
ncbi:uncharacterized protein LOC121920535 [Sceloporus undulatus]|uniref:uncharacterized protein LOC121920535 n=1 Tax=Sceloporus undulatus TaxID=8520 RepID=UPI001C4CE4BD|nr:uncharacterized protein LOC121920535 [Sceloporus undulatus]